METAPLVASSESVRDSRARSPQPANNDNQKRNGVEDSPPSPQSPSGEEQALESHEVIELQSFSERKAWIEEKIKFLEALPPVEVFIGLSAIQSSLENVPGLPTRIELQQWMTEHDIIEKETEIFDKGELKKLRQLTKAATQRNLSPEDTDVIELTLTTIYTLDKLLHLLRDRSENLEMMSTRLLWEESRQASWKEQRQIIEDLHKFATDRARWNASIYDEISTEFEDHTISARRGSVASQASANSDNIINSPAFSRSTRFKFTEMLSRDAAQFSGRITSLKHGKVAAAGKALDKLIDQSRKPVPDEFLDEQDRLEEKCINEMENVSKFTMNLVMQWRKADEIYVETKKDYIAASFLLEEIEMAKLYHPTARQSSSFVSRADTIVKRLAIRGDPASHSKLFPRPEHFLFPDQNLANENLVRALANDVAAAKKLASAVNLAAKEYKELYDRVRKVETLLQNVGHICTDFSLILKKFQEGIPSEDEDGSPPILTSESCLNAASHALYIALFPSLLEEAGKVLKAADEYLHTSPALLMALDSPGIEKQFKEGAAAELQKLSSLRDQAVSVRDSTTKRLARLRDSRRISALIDSKLAFLRATKKEIVLLIERDRWRQQFGSMEAPPTPESPVSELSPSPSSNVGFEQRLSEVSFVMNSDIMQPLENLSGNLELELRAHLDQKIASLQRSLEDGQQTLNLLGRIREQSCAMTDIRNDFHDIMTRIEDTKLQINNLIDAVLNDHTPTDVTHASDISIQGNADIGSTYLDPIQTTATAFVDGLSKRVFFVARHAASATNPATSLKSPSLSSGLGVSTSDETTILPFDLGSLDSIVRADSNSYALKINGGIECLLQLNGHFELSKLAKEVNTTLLAVSADIDIAAQALSGQKALIVKISRQTEDTHRNLQDILNVLETIQTQHARIVLALPPIEEEILIMDSKSKSLESSIRDGLYKPQSALFRGVENRSKKLGQEITEFVVVVQQAIATEQRYWDDVKKEQLRRAKEEQERLAIEEENRAQLERQRAEEEERQKALEVRLAEEREKDAEIRRQMAELAEKQRAEQEAAESERLRLRKLEEEAEVARVAAEEERRAKQEAERARLEQERMDAVQKLHSIEAELEKERRMHAESGLAAASLAHRQQTEMDELTKRQAEMEALAQESIYRAEMERISKARMEKEAKEHEKHFLQRYSELQQLANEQAHLAEIERSERERAERVAQGYAEVLTEQHVKALRLAEENARQIEFERTEKVRAEKEAEKLAKELEQQKIQQVTINDNQDISVQQNLEDVQDVFGILESPTTSKSSISESLAHLQTQIMALRKRLRSICMDEVLFPTKGSKQLPTDEQFQKIQDNLTGLATEVQLLPMECNNRNLQVELTSLRVELDQRQQSLQKIQKLVHLSSSIQICDNALSDLLEHIDSYPVAPLLLLSTHTSLPTASSEEQLSSRLAFTESVLKDMESEFATAASDHRAVSEHSRVNQTWVELREMANDRLNGRKSRPASVISSGRNSSISTNPGPPSSTRGAKKRSSYSHLSVSSLSSISKGTMLAPSVPPAKSRRAVSSTNEPTPRSSSRSSIATTARSASGSISIGKGVLKSNEVGVRSTSRMSSASSTRSVSGPLNTSLHGSTFASRQRTTSLSAVVPAPPRRTSLTPSRFRMNDEIKRGISPAISETSSYSHSHSSVGPRSSLNASTWSRAPRDSLSSLLPRVGTPHKKVAPVRKKYVADPKSKLDVAVGDVVNQLEVGINIEGITESWRDQSGKYWIGNQDPKLCFCRILRSQTVMVRVGGGWTELSKFIKDHFAESFQIGVGPSSPPRSGGQTEKWISSMTLLEARESLSPPRGPHTPEPTFVPSFSLVTPSGQSPKSIKSLSPTSLGSSPLTPLQFMRRAEPVPDNSLLRPATPSKPPLRSSRTSTSNTPARTSVWRP